jgi:flagellar protein FliO/FliZ
MSFLFPIGTSEQTPLVLPSPAQHAQTVSTGGSLLRTIAGLLVVIAVVYGLSWLLRQMKSAKEQRSAGTGLATLATLPLGPGRTLHLVRSGAEILLVGASEKSVVPIRVYSADEAEQAGLVSHDDGPGDDAGGGGAAPADTVLGRILTELRRRTVRE